MTGRDPLPVDMRQAPGWYAILPEPGPAKRLKGGQTADWVVVGAGVFRMTRNWASHFGRLEPRVFVSLGYCGVGLLRGTISGRLLAEYAMGSESGPITDVQALSRPRPLPPRSVLGIGIRARLAWHRWRTRAEA